MDQSSQFNQKYTYMFVLRNSRESAKLLDIFSLTAALYMGLVAVVCFIPFHIHWSLPMLCLCAYSTTPPPFHRLSSFSSCINLSFHNSCPCPFISLRLVTFSISPFSPFLSIDFALLILLSTPHSSFLPGLSGISLWRWIWSLCVSTATNAFRTSWNVGWPGVSLTRKRRRRNYYPCVCDPCFHLPLHFCHFYFGQFPPSFLFVSMLFLFHCPHTLNMLHSTLFFRSVIVSLPGFTAKLLKIVVVKIQILHMIKWLNAGFSKEPARSTCQI